MTKILVCVDGSVYADNICENAAWAAKKLNADIDLLHVLRRHSDYDTPSDYTGSIGLGARSDLLEKLTQVDEERGRFDQQKGRIILEHAQDVLKNLGVKNINVIHRRGSLVDTIKEFEETCEMIFIGKRGEHADLNSAFLGSNLEKVARAVTKPLFVVSSNVSPIKKFLIAYDGKASAQHAVEYVTQSPLLSGAECHLVSIYSKSDTIDLDAPKIALKDAGFNVTDQHIQSDDIDDAIVNYVREQSIDLLISGAYSHSRLHSILLGSTTASLCKRCKIPLLMFR